jgi:hypothetical protein
MRRIVIGITPHGPQEVRRAAHRLKYEDHARLRSLRLRQLDRADGCLPRPLVDFRLEFDLLALSERTQASPLKRGDVNKHVVATADRRYEAVTSVDVEELHCPLS